MTVLKLGARKILDKWVGGTEIKIEANMGNLDAIEQKCGVCAKIVEWFDTPGYRALHTAEAISALAVEPITVDEILKLMRPADMIPVQLAIIGEIRNSFTHKEELAEEDEVVDVGLQEIDGKKTTP